MDKKTHVAKLEMPGLHGSAALLRFDQILTAVAQSWNVEYRKVKVTTDSVEVEAATWEAAAAQWAEHEGNLVSVGWTVGADDGHAIYANLNGLRDGEWNWKTLQVQGPDEQRVAGCATAIERRLATLTLDAPDQTPRGVEIKAEPTLTPAQDQATPPELSEHVAQPSISRLTGTSSPASSVVVPPSERRPRRFVRQAGSFVRDVSTQTIAGLLVLLIAAVLGLQALFGG